MRHVTTLALALVLGLATGCTTAQADERVDQRVDGVQRQAAELAADGQLLRAAELLDREADREDLDPAIRRDLLAAAARRYAEVGRDRLALDTAERAGAIESSREMDALMQRMRERLAHAGPRAPIPPPRRADVPFDRDVAPGARRDRRSPTRGDDVVQRLERLERSLAEVRELLARHDVGPDDRRRAEEGLRRRLRAPGPRRAPPTVAPIRDDHVRAGGRFTPRDHLGPQQDRVKELRRQRIERERQLSVRRQELQRAEARLVALRSRPDPDTEAELERVETRVAELRDALAEAERRLEESAAGYADARRRLEQVRDVTVRTDAGPVTFADARRARLARLRNQLEEERTRLTDLRRELEAYRERLEQVRAEGEVGEDDAAVNSLRRLTARRTTEIEGLEQRIRRRREELEAVQAELERRPVPPRVDAPFVGGRPPHAARPGEHDRRPDAASRELDELRAELDRARRRNAELRARLEQFRVESEAE